MKPVIETHALCKSYHVRPVVDYLNLTVPEGCVYGFLGPTGAGKSICYQVPALLLPGITIGVSPLGSLMKDQVGALVQAGVAAAFLNNSLTDNQKALMLHRAREGWYKII